MRLFDSWGEDSDSIVGPPPVPQVVWETPTLAVLHVACFGLNSARRADMMAELRREIWSAGGVVATAQSGDTRGAGGSSTTGRTLSAIGRTVSTGALASSGSVGGQVLSGWFALTTPKIQQSTSVFRSVYPLSRTWYHFDCDGRTKRVI